MAQSLSSFADLFRSVERSAVHLEMRDVYAIDDEDEGFAAWRRGHRLDPDDRASWWRPWLDLMEEVTSKGVRVRRARIVGEPPSEYIRYEHSFSFTNIAAGEEIRWLPRRLASGLALPGNDFWLFDGKLVQFNVFDGEGRWIHTDQTEDQGVAGLCSDAFEAVWERATPHDTYTI
ncbi:DUF6879 family protein [Streptomyces halstedii]|uniref:DUF6879 family protein n=1 Tax=Streptomyces TaxID=1883 RepID=UPI0004903400|nr:MULTISPECIES: DUF6879 family protein [Streptomyces]MYR74796.1 hypothetical protein [Streptomyces sp. SID4925]MYY15472.1 hypothetical protein [Streptomyces sp. SID4912]SBU90316.1 hypothetical protein YUMDRAFT_01022 [Streptomyces sp. OspMP-M45]SCD66399.1 hypothetical protein GA0115241_105153 [Streptomyces sp. DpondAA-D4]